MSQPGGGILEGFRWSYSKLDIAAECPYSFKKIYLDHLPPAENAFAQTGSLCHQLLADYALRKRESFELLPAFEQAFRRVKAPWPPYPAGVQLRTHDKLCRYFRGFRGFGEAEVLAVEEKLIWTIAGRPFSGILDLVLRDRDGSLCVVDHKTGSLSEFQGQRLERHKMQPLLYSFLYSQCHGGTVDWLVFNLCKEDRWLTYRWTAFQERQALSWTASVMDLTEGLMNRYYRFLTPLQQKLQLALIKGDSLMQARRRLRLSSRRLQYLMMEMDETAMALCGQRERPGGFGCRFICSARDYCDDGRAG